MKNAIFLFVLFIFSLSTADAQDNRVEQNLKMYKTTWDKVINKGQIDQINATNFDENIVMISQPENVVGIQNFKAYYQNFLTGFSNIEFRVIDAFGQGDQLVKHWRFKGKHTGDFFGIPATGKVVDVEGVTLVKMKNGKIVQEHDFMDSMIFMQQLGLMSEPNNIGLINSLYDAFMAGDVPTVLAGMDPSVNWNEAEGNKYADGNPYQGPDAVLKGVFSRIGEDHEYFKLKEIELHEMSNNKVLATLRYDGKWKGGKQYDVQAAHLWTVHNGKVVAFQQYVDTRTLAETSKQ
ncbi:ester cyclase [Salinimicrobium oceani]|uniref:SnoaL-like domain-containing protein n=1 Tax=Salinimicrobium oceani TaxID=2722702 RepID=A0ABX1CX73_9FLAO|nr:ester cyclase [Salinimicrobium oceani]NJW51549.1 SnoaL-like domain-containing protein [Salinimicrobium oceani]